MKTQTLAAALLQLMPLNPVNPAEFIDIEKVPTLVENTIAFRITFRPYAEEKAQTVDYLLSEGFAQNPVGYVATYMLKRILGA